MKKMKNLLALFLAAVMMFSLAACGNKETTESPSASDTGEAATTSGSETSSSGVLVIGNTASFEEKWNPFISDSAYDSDVLVQIFSSILVRNEDNELVPDAGTVEAEETDDGGMLYTVTLNKGITFSDGEEVTIDDYIYSLYVRADPSYTGLVNLLPVKIEGVAEYYYDDENYSVKVSEIEAEAEANWTNENISFENFLVYAEATALEGWWDADLENEDADGAGHTWIGYAEACGYEAQVAEIDTTDVDAVFELIAKVEYETSLDSYDPSTWYAENAKEEYALGNLEGGTSVEEISGITRVDDYTCTIKMTELDVFGEVTLFEQRNGCGNLIPSHYYGEFEKGDVSAILANMEPMGSGPYIWGGFEDNIVTCTANENYWEGVPKTGTVRWQYVPETEIVTALSAGTVDISEPTANDDNIESLEAAGLEIQMVDNAGYGYVGLNTENLELNVRKGILSLMNRQPAVEGYFNDLAVVIERPMTTTVAEYPQDATEYYGYDVDKALEYFEAAGYSQVDGKLVNAAGEQLVINVYVGGSGEGAHPSYSMLVQASEDLASMGGELQIQDVNFNVLQAAMKDGTADMYCLAWGESFDCDASSRFRSDGSQNYSKVNDQKMDDLLDQIKVTIDFDERAALVSDMLDYVMDLCLEFPVYQRQNIFVYNTQNINMDTIPEAGTYYNYKSVLWQVEVTG